MTERLLHDVRGRIGSRWTRRRAACVRASIDRRVQRRRLLLRSAAVGALGVFALVSALLVRDRFGFDHGSQALSSGPASATSESSPTMSPSSAMAKGAPPAANRSLATGHVGAARQPAGVDRQPMLPTQEPPRQGEVDQPTATPLSGDTELVVDPHGAGRAFILRRGGARFVVAHDESRPFRVRAGAILIEDLGTVFSVTRLSERQFDVNVEEGRVAVHCGESRTDLDRGQRRTFECAERTEGEGSARHAETSPRNSGGVRRTSESTWKILAQHGQYGEAYESLRNAGQNAIPDETTELLLAADTARLSGHPAEAVPYLQRILARHGGDPRADVTAFTLGRVLLDELGRPGEAAEAFERARAARSPLAEDALAREVEARARAGERGRARALANQYQSLYPHGRRAGVVAKFGGLE